MREPYNTDWSDVPHTDKRAHPIEEEQVKKALAIYVTKACIRSAIVEKRYFEIADVAEPYSTFSGKQRVEVRCLWYKRKPKVTWMHLTLLGKHHEEEDYTGSVVRNIGR